jgi:hypothetical protein
VAGDAELLGEQADDGLGSLSPPKRGRICVSRIDRARCCSPAEKTTN